MNPPGYVAARALGTSTMWNGPIYGGMSTISRELMNEISRARLRS